MTQNSTTTSAPGASLLPDGTAALTTIHFALIAVLAILVIAGILWGIRQKRVRKAAEHEIVSNAEEAGVAPVVERAIEAAAPPASIPPAPTPVAPPPPPLADQPVPGIPAEPAPLAHEPIPATTAFEASPASEAIPPAPAPASALASPADGPVTQLKGLGPKVAARLGELGITTVGQIAALDVDAAQALDAQLGAFTGRMARDRWVEQARFLAAGDTAGFEAAFGKL